MTGGFPTTQGTIEHGMLSVLAFKKSLFAGVLDGGAREVFLHGTRLTRVMESVDQVTGRMGDMQTPDAAWPVNWRRRPVRRAAGGTAPARATHGWNPTRSVARRT